MKASRRAILGLLLAGLPGAALFFRKRARDARPFTFEETFKALIDTFVPADESPGAIALGIDQQILAKIYKNNEYLAKIRDAVDVLQRNALQREGMGFGRLDLERRVSLLNHLLSDRNGDKNTRIQITSLRANTLTRFYTSDQAFEMLSYHPPSRGGYPDYNAVPL